MAKLAGSFGLFGSKDMAMDLASDASMSSCVVDGASTRTRFEAAMTLTNGGRALLHSALLAESPPSASAGIRTMMKQRYVPFRSL